MWLFSFWNICPLIFFVRKSHREGLYKFSADDKKYLYFCPFEFVMLFQSATVSPCSSFLIFVNFFLLPSSQTISNFHIIIPIASKSSKNEKIAQTTWVPR